jgi:hypothetical protein
MAPKKSKNLRNCMFEELIVPFWRAGGFLLELERSL